MDDKSLYGRLLGLSSPWAVDKVELRLEQGEVHVWVVLPSKELWVCPDCQARAPIHDHRERVWRHLDTFQYRTMLHARVPRLNCPRHGVRQLPVPWAEEGSRFTALYEALAIDWMMKQAALAAVAQRLHLTWDEAAGIQERAVRRGLARRQLEPARHLGVDETSLLIRDAVCAASARAANAFAFAGACPDSAEADIRQIRTLIDQSRRSSGQAVADGELTPADWETLDGYLSLAQASLAPGTLGEAAGFLEHACDFFP
ncbi:MAG: hypothetical protein FJ280_13200 [Planctomycetes bacterium]|nr:hypothetical protein [Planctomycetota bacterium]